jgi:hypothetical protein
MNKEYTGYDFKFRWEMLFFIFAVCRMYIEGSFNLFLKAINNFFTYVVDIIISWE